MTLITPLLTSLLCPPYLSIFYEPPPFPNIKLLFSLCRTWPISRHLTAIRLPCFSGGPDRYINVWLYFKRGSPPLYKHVWLFFRRGSRPLYKCVVVFSAGVPTAI